MFGKKVNSRIKVQHGKEETGTQGGGNKKALKGAYSSSFGVFPLRLGCWMGAWADKTSYISSISKDTGQGLGRQ